MLPPVAGKERSKSHFVCGSHVERLHCLIFKRRAWLWGGWGFKVRPPLPHRAPCCRLKTHLRWCTPDAHPLAGFLIQFPHVGRSGQEHAMAQWAMAGGALLPFARATLIIHHTKPSPAHGTPILLPNLALLHTSPHDSYTGCGPIRAAAEQQPSQPDGGQEAASSRQPWPASSRGGCCAEITVAAAS